MYELNKKPRFMLVGLVPMGTNDETILLEMEEVESLVKTYGGEVFAATVQKSHNADRSQFVGPGKAEEIADAIALEKIDIVVINALANAGQLYNLEKIFYRSNLNIKVWDRMDLILHIFALHAHTKEAKLQIDLASLHHMGPRTYSMGYILSRQGGGIGTVGVGETNTEIMKRHWQKEMRRISAELTRLLGERKKQIEKRKSLGFLTASIVGYTNAGKTLLFNRLTKKENYVSANLFATLDSNVGKVIMSGKRRDITVTDTIGFIKNLPPDLIDAFKSTLIESVNADLLLIVVDVSDPEYPFKLKVVDEILNELLLADKKRIYIFNKIDKIDTLDKTNLVKQYALKSPICISAKTGEGIDILFNKIEQAFE
jgi:GTPase